MYTMDEQEKVERSTPHPVNEVEWDETELWSKGLDAAHSHGCEDGQDNDSSDRGEDVLYYAVPEAPLVAGIQPKGAQMSKEVDASPEEQAKCNDGVE